MQNIMQINKLIYKKYNANKQSNLQNIVIPLIFKREPMITDLEIIEVLEPYNTEIRKWHEEGLKLVNDLTDVVANKNCRLYKRNKAGILNNYIVEQASKYFDGIEGIQVDRKYETIVLKFDSGVAGRFKKQATHIKESCKCTTRNNHYIQGTLYEEYPQNVSLEIIYDVNEVFSEIVRLSIIKRVDRIPIEIYSIIGIEQEQPATFRAMEVVLPDENQENQITIKTS